MNFKMNNRAHICSDSRQGVYDFGQAAIKWLMYVPAVGQHLGLKPQKRENYP